MVVFLELAESSFVGVYDTAVCYGLHWWEFERLLSVESFQSLFLLYFAGSCSLVSVNFGSG